VIVSGNIIAQQYEILDRISEGGMATVYTARRMADGSIVALKVLREQYASDAEFIERFQREAKAVSELAHPHMVRVYDSGRDGSVHYIAMEYVEGANLKEYIRREGRLAPERALQIAAQVCEALEFAHSHNIVHRDIKPQNILLTRDGQLKLTDFGIARALSSATITQTGTVLGSVQYLSPEQARGSAVGRAADIYALGVVLYEMVTGQLPFEGDSPIAVALAHVHKAPPTPSSLVPGLSELAEGIILRAMMKSPTDRYRSAGEMRGDLLGETELWRVPPPQRVLEETTPTLVLAGEAVEEAEAKAPPQSLAVTIAVVGLLVIAGLWGGWRVFTNYLAVPEVTVPNFVGQPLETAQRTADAARLTLQVSDQVYSADAPLDTIVSQDQPAEKTVKQGRVINVAVSLGTEMVIAPDVERRTLLEARLLLEQVRLRVGELRETFDEQVKGGFVIQQDPQPGARVARGRAINLVISKGSQRVEMPTLIGRPLAEARRLLQDIGVTLSEVRSTAATDIEPGVVIEQSPRAGTVMRAADPVSVTVTVRPGQESAPPVTPLVTAQAQPAPSPDEKLTNVQLVVPAGEPNHEVKLVVVDEAGVRTVLRKILAPGTRISQSISTRGYTIIQVYLQGRLVQEIRP
jgi:serine/threonine-protein kinase